MNRRVLLHTLVSTGIGTILSPLIARASNAADGDRTVFEQDLPRLLLDNWKMTALEVTYAPGEMDRAHRHPGFVFGYVLDGSIRFQLEGQTTTTYHAGQMFYEFPGSVHRQSGNASTTEPARLLAMIFAPRDQPLTTLV
jgi:quercetin dioxygenase-like cupin family protein